MNTLVATGLARRSRSHIDGPASATPAYRTTAFAHLLCGLMMALALLSYFVQVLDEHVQRAQQLRQAQHRSAAPIHSATQGPAPDAARQFSVQTAAR